MAYLTSRVLASNAKYGTQILGDPTLELCIRVDLKAQIQQLTTSFDYVSQTVTLSARLANEEIFELVLTPYEEAAASAWSIVGMLGQIGVTTAAGNGSGRKEAVGGKARAASARAVRSNRQARRRNGAAVATATEQAA